MQFISGVQQGDHAFLFKYVNNHAYTYFEHKTEDGTTHRYRYVNNVPLHKTHSDFQVNFIEYWEMNKKGTIQHFCWVTDITITNDNIYDIMRGGRSNWKIESAPQEHKTATQEVLA